MPRVQNTSTNNTPSPIPATKAMLYKTQKLQNSLVYNGLVNFNLAAILDFKRYVM